MIEKQVYLNYNFGLFLCKDGSKEFKPGEDVKGEGKTIFRLQEIENIVSYNFKLGRKGDYLYFVIDVDSKNGESSVLKSLMERFPDDFNNTIKVITPSGGYHYYFRMMPPLGKKIRSQVMERNVDGKVLLEFKCDNVVGFGSKVNGKVYEIISSSKQIKDCSVSFCNELFSILKESKENVISPLETKVLSIEEKAQLFKKLKKKADDGAFDAREDWISLGKGLYSCGYSIEDFKALSWDSVKEQELSSVWNSFEGNKATIGSLLHFLKKKEEYSADSIRKQEERKAYLIGKYRDVLFWGNEKSADRNNGNWWLNGKVCESNAEVLANFNGKEETEEVKEFMRDYKEVKDVIWNPNPSVKTNDKIFNRFKGFDVKPNEKAFNEGKHLDFIRFIENSLFHGLKDEADKKEFHFFMSWISQMFQEPHIKSEVAVGITGESGAGKTFISDVIISLMGKEVTKEIGTSTFKSTFNSELEKTIFANMSETVFTPDPLIEASVKEAITARTLNINKKFCDARDVDNYTRFYFTSNDKNFLNIKEEGGKRRFFVLEIKKILTPEEYEEMGKKFGKTAGITENKEALMHYFLNYKFEPGFFRRIPMTRVKQENMIKSLNKVQEMLYHMLEEWPFKNPMRDFEDETEVLATELFDYYKKNFAFGGRDTQVSFANEIKAFFKDVDISLVKKNNRKGTIYIFTKEMIKQRIDKIIGE